MASPTFSEPGAGVTEEAVVNAALIVATNGRNVHRDGVARGVAL